MAKILIVEDNALNIKLFCDLLAAHGHEPNAVTDSRLALRKDDELSEVPIMAVTAYSTSEDEERIRAAGAQAYVSKPISVVRFAETVEQLLNQKDEPVIDDSANDVSDGPGPGETGGEEC